VRGVQRATRAATKSSFLRGRVRLVNDRALVFTCDSAPVSRSEDNVTLEDVDRPIDRIPINEVDSEYASSMAGRALQLMALHNVPATPQNFEVWFTFARGTAPDLSKTIKILLANKRPFDAGTNHSLYVNYIEGRSDCAQHTLLSAELQKVLLNAQQFLATTLTDNRRQVEALDTVASQMDENCDPRPIIKSLVGELSKAAGLATELEAHFTASLHELDNIRDKLTISERRSRTDPLTGLANRRALDDFVRGAQIASMETGAPLSIMLVDIDRFKQFNDKFGHQFGDQVLRRSDREHASGRSGGAVRRRRVARDPARRRSNGVSRGSRARQADDCPTSSEAAFNGRDLIQRHGFDRGRAVRCG